MVNLSRLSMSFIDAADFPGEKKTGRSEAGGGDIFRDLFLELPTELKKSISILDQFIFEFVHPPGVRDISGPNQGNALFLSPQGKVFRVQISRGGPREMGVNVQICDKGHGGEYVVSTKTCQFFCCSITRRHVPLRTAGVIYKMNVQRSMENEKPAINTYFSFSIFSPSSLDVGR